MEEQDVIDRTVYLVRHGSHAYGLNIATSDVDEKGICMMTSPAYLYGLKKFEQKDTWSDGVDRTIYDIRKFFNLALECNPNIIEVLYVDDSDILKMTKVGRVIRENRDIFLSTKARNSFVGYAISQLKRIRGHKKWIDAPPDPPKEEDFIHVCELQPGQSTPWKREYDSHQIKVHPCTSEVVKIEHFDEGGFKAAKKKYNEYQSWRRFRNPSRFALEEQFGYDTKHAMHLLRLLRMGVEIISDGKVVVKRPDRDELLAVRAGKFDYDTLVAEAEKTIEKIDNLVLSSPLPDAPDRDAAEKLLVEMLTA